MLMYAGNISIILPCIFYFNTSLKKITKCLTGLSRYPNVRKSFLLLSLFSANSFVTIFLIFFSKNQMQKKDFVALPLYFFFKFF